MSKLYSDNELRKSASKAVETRKVLYNIMQWVVDECPLSSEFETDARTVWPKRWALLKRKLELINLS